MRSEAISRSKSCLEICRIFSRDDCGGTRLAGQQRHLAECLALPEPGELLSRHALFVGKDADRAAFDDVKRIAGIAGAKEHRARGKTSRADEWKQFLDRLRRQMTKDIA